MGKIFPYLTVEKEKVSFDTLLLKNQGRFPLSPSLVFASRCPFFPSKMPVTQIMNELNFVWESLILSLRDLIHFEDAGILEIYPSIKNLLTLSVPFKNYLFNPLNHSHFITSKKVCSLFYGIKKA